MAMAPGGLRLRRLEAGHDPNHPEAARVRPLHLLRLHAADVPLSLLLPLTQSEGPRPGGRSPERDAARCAGPDLDRGVLMFSSLKILFASCRHYFVREGGQWRCTMCGETR